MEDIAATPMTAIFTNEAGLKIGDFSGLVTLEEIRLDGHGEGSYEPPHEGQVFVVISEPRPIRACVERAHIRRGVIGFRAWLSQK